MINLCFDEAVNINPVTLVSLGSPLLNRFLVQWLAASLSNVPLVMYQTRLVQMLRDPNDDCDADADVNNDDFGADIVASICTGVEERGWDAKQLLQALLDGGKTSLFDVDDSKPTFEEKQ